MNFTNINDPAGVKALLDQLRSSQAWQDTLAQSTNAVGRQETPNLVDARGSGNQPATSTSTVAALLLQLQTSTVALPKASNLPQTEPQLEQPVPVPTPEHVWPKSSALAPPRSRTQDGPHHLTFQQTLPLLAQLADDPTFVSSLARMKEDQDELERTLWTERRSIYKKYEDKVKVAQTRANMAGAGLTKREADMLSEAFQKELREFDRLRILPAWDGLIAKQQATLENHTVPTKAVTNVPSERERQQRVIQVLEGILG